MCHFDVGVRYMFNEKVNAKVFYKIDNFVNDPGGKVGIRYNTFGVSGIYNLGKHIGLTYLTRDKVGINLHVDGGISYAYLKTSSYVREKVGVGSIGITPMYRVSNKVALNTDLTYNYTLKQHYGFDGVLLYPSFKGQNGSFYNFTVGLIYYIGENKYHSNWY